MPLRTLVSWSGGKDAAWTLHRLRADPAVEVAGLFTTVRATDRMVGIHEIPLSLVEAQAAAAGLPLTVVPLPPAASNAAYAAAVLPALRAAGVDAIAFGDLFLEEIRAWREALLDGSGLRPLFPLWGEPTAALARRMVGEGLRARVCAVDPARLPGSLVGAAYDAAFLDALPPDVDPCGERGEFHTAVLGGPMLAGPVRHP